MTIPTVLWGLFLLYATLKPSDGSNDFPMWLRKFHPDKIEHFGAWFVWYWIYNKTYLKSISDFKKYFTAIKFIIFGSCFGIIIEILQWKLQWGRSAEWQDWLADSLGLLAAVLIFNKKGSVS